MKRVLLPLVVLLVALVLPSAVLAKGASEATIVGPGLDGPIVVGGSGDLASAETLGGIAQESGFYGAVFGQSPDPMLAKRPTGRLGPAYTVTYTMPGPNNSVYEIAQTVYPYAQPDPVTHVEPGQRFWDGERTRGGWYVAPYSTLREQLVAAGLPPTAPVVDGGGQGFPWLLATIAGVIAMAGLGCVAVIMARRRPRPVAA